MKLGSLLDPLLLGFAIVLLAGCSGRTTTKSPGATTPQPLPSFFKVDPATAGSVAGRIRYIGKRPRPKPIDMSDDPACVKLHHGKVYDESLVVNREGELANAFVYVKRGLEGKSFEVPATPVTIDQKGCQFLPHVLGIQVGQVLRIVNSDPLTHHIHPVPQNNVEWSQSQGPGAPPLERKFMKPEIMIPIKCNIHGWMTAYLGVLNHPYFSVSGKDGSFEIPNLPPGTYTIAVWQETLGTQERQITVPPRGTTEVDFTFKGR